MWSKKHLLIVLIISTAIFVIAIAFGQAWWQSLIYSIGFLLIISVIFGGGGMLLPEGLLGGRSSKQHFEPGSKDDFFEKMDTDLRDFSDQPKATTEDIHWLTEYTRLMKGIGELVFIVHDSVKSGDRIKQLRAFQGAIKDIPRLITAFKNIPTDLALLDKDTITRQTEGFDLYLAACCKFSEAIEKSNGELASDAAKQINNALDMTGIIQKTPTVPREMV